MEQIGIVEIDSKVEKLKQFKTEIQGLLEKRKDKKPFMLFKELRS